MRRGIACLLAAATLGGISPALHAQYPYPYPQPAYGPMPMAMPQPMPMPQPMAMPYGYPPAMMPAPSYAPPPMYAPPPPGMPPRPSLTYYPAPMPPAPPYPYSPPPRVINYGPLMDASTPVNAYRYNRPAAPPMAPSPIRQAQAVAGPPALPMLPPAGALAAGSTGIVRTGAVGVPLPTDGCTAPGCAAPGCAAPGCGAACMSGGCATGCDNCGIAFPHTTLWPEGHFIGDVGVLIWVPYPETRNAYTTSSPGNSTTTTFEHDAEAAPFFQLGYVFHCGWGVRADFWFMHSDDTLSTSNANPATMVTGAVGPPFQLTSPGVALKNGIGTDTFNFNREFDFKVGDLEVIKECNIFDIFILFGGGVRYAQIQQSYSANRTNGGGTSAAGTAVSVDQEQVGTTSQFDGVGPTYTIEVVHPIRGSCFSLYGNVRGSFLFGNEELSQNYSASSAVTPAGGPTTFTNTTASGPHTSTRCVPVIDYETGIQIGKRWGRCYLWARAGFAYGRWWDVGSPTSDTGNLDLIGGALKVGIIY